MKPKVPSRAIYFRRKYLRTTLIRQGRAVRVINVSLRLAKSTLVGLTATRTGGMSSLDVPRVTYVVAFLLFATAIGDVLVSGDVKSHIKSLRGL